MTDFKNPVPNDRTIVPGIWSDVLDCFKASFKTSGQRTGLNVNNDNFLIEVASGNVPGKSLLGFVTRNPAVSTTFEDVWAEGGSLVYPTAAETWEIVSDNLNDSASGSGGRTGVLTSLDENLVRQFTPFVMNGTTPVVLSNTHFRPESVVILTAGSSESNEGSIIVRPSGGGNTRNTILPDIGQSMDGHITVPANTTALVLQTFSLFPKDGGGTVRTRVRSATDPDSSWISAAFLPVYQNNLTFLVKALFPLGPGTDVQMQARSETGPDDVSVIFEFLFTSIP